MQCRHCNSLHFKKNGHDQNGKQNYVCKDCSRAFVAQLEPRQMTKEDQILAIKLRTEGLSMRAVARLLARGATTLRTFFKKSALPLVPDCPPGLPSCVPASPNSKP